MGRGNGDVFTFSIMAGLELIFAYGSLLRETGNVQVDRAMAEAGSILGRGYLQGGLYDLGEYPGALPDGRPEDNDTGDPVDPDARVWGRLIALRDPESFFAIMDDYEGFNSRKPDESEFIRTRTLVYLPESSKTYTSHVYFYNQSVQGKDAIPSGDYLAYLNAKEQSP